MNIYEKCPVLESEKFIVRLFQNEDCDDLLKVYSDKNALPFFNSDNCDGDNFYYATKERMKEAVDNDGTVKAKREGSTTITASSNDGSGVVGTCTVTISLSRW